MTPPAQPATTPDIAPAPAPAPASQPSPLATNRSALILGHDHPEVTPSTTEHTSALFDAAMDALWSLKTAPDAFPTRVTSDEDAILIATAAAMRADCTRRKVGCAVFDAHGRLLRTGRNGAPAGYPGCLSAGACPRGQMSTDQIAPGSSYRGAGTKCTALHAEKNGLLFTDPIARRGGFMAVTDAPCDDCSLDLAGSGLARVIWPEQAATGGWVIRERLLGPGQPVGGLYD